MSVVHGIASCPELTDVLLWDAIERCWRIGHGRRLITGLDEVHWVDLSMADAEDCLIDGEPVSVFTSVTHWSPLPQPVEGE